MVKKIEEIDIDMQDEMDEAIIKIDNLFRELGLNNMEILWIIEHMKNWILNGDDEE